MGHRHLAAAAPVARTVGYILHRLDDQRFDLLVAALARVSGTWIIDQTGQALSNESATAAADHLLAAVKLRTHRLIKRHLRIKCIYGNSENAVTTLFCMMVWVERGAQSSQCAQISMTGKRRWVDNAFVEWLWRSAKYDEIHLHADQTISAVRTALERYLEFNSKRRSHQRLDDRTPMRCTSAKTKSIMRHWMKHESHAASCLACVKIAARIPLWKTLHRNSTTNDYPFAV